MFQARHRGPSVTHRRAKEQAAEAAAAEQKKTKKPSTKKALGAALGLAGVAAAGIVYGRGSTSLVATLGGERYK